jgi:ribonuclease PH
VDCDVIEADGGTRVASINGACLALWDACDALVAEGKLKSSPFRGPLGAISVGLVRDQLLADLCYMEDRDADADMNVVTDSDSSFVMRQLKPIALKLNRVFSS